MKRVLVSLTIFFLFLSTTVAQGGFLVDLTAADDANDVYKVNPYTAPDDHTPYSNAGFIDIIEFGVYADQESGLVKMNATFTDAPIFNSTTDYFMQYSIQPEQDDVIIEIQFNFRYANNNSFFATQQLFFANESQSVDEIDFTYNIVGETLFGEGTFEFPSIFNLTNPIPGNYLVRVEALNDLDPNSDTFNVEDRARYDFSVNNLGEITEITDEPDIAGVPISFIPAFIAIFSISIVVRKVRSIKN